MRILSVFIGLSLLPCTGFAQSSNPFKSYKTQEDYCRENPKMPTCMNGKPITMDGGGLLYKSTLKAPMGAGGALVTAPSRPSQPAARTLANVTLEDWRFSHPSPALLVSVNIGSLVRSPMWTKLFSAWGVEWKAADIEKVRAALSDVGQVLISVKVNAGAANPSVLILAKGNVDSALGAMLRSGSGMQSKRLDAITTLIGDPESMQFASLRLRGPASRTTSNSLQQAATQEGLKYDAWVGIDPRHLTSMASAFGAGSNPSLGMLANLRGVSVGLYLRDQLRIEASLDAPSAEAANRMLAAYRQMEAKQPGGKKAGQQWVTAEGAKLRFIEIADASGLAELDPDTARLIGPQIAPLMHALAGLGSAQRSASTAAPKPTGGIVIQGLDGGPKELPAK